eukprot:364209-Chlamydomonas_euryale.AAC.9
MHALLSAWKALTERECEYTTTTTTTITTTSPSIHEPTSTHFAVNVAMHRPAGSSRSVWPCTDDAPSSGLAPSHAPCRRKAAYGQGWAGNVDGDGQGNHATSLVAAAQPQDRQQSISSQHRGRPTQAVLLAAPLHGGPGEGVAAFRAAAPNPGSARGAQRRTPRPTPGGTNSDNSALCRSRTVKPQQAAERRRLDLRMSTARNARCGLSNVAGSPTGRGERAWTLQRHLVTSRPSAKASTDFHALRQGVDRLSGPPQRCLETFRPSPKVSRDLQVCP